MSYFGSTAILVERPCAQALYTKITKSGPERWIEPMLLSCQEPPRQYQPVKHCLGYVLMVAGKNQTAAEVSNCQWLHCTAPSDA
jgi:hypothetical protein